MSEIIRKRYRVYGIVQGVGFRPFVSRIAEEARVSGSVCNKGPYVEIFAQGSCDQVTNFRYLLKDTAPERSSILKIEEKEVPIESEREFSIIESEKVAGDIFVSPDIATCPQCQRELFDPNDRRYLHPFINCTACGPRMTILDKMPYDRVRTSMKDFPMCPECEWEYTHPETRRYHAQPVCCNDCGPELYILPTKRSEFLDREKVLFEEEASAPHIRGTEALLVTRDVIRRGGIAAIKGIGGFHLCCDATSQKAVSRLRALKNRPFKAFAVMARSIDVLKKECVVEEAQEKVLQGPQKPILLLKRRAELEKRKICEAVAPENPKVGVMLPYAPVQLLLFDYPDGAPMPDFLVMTSANPSGAPICKDDEDVMTNLAEMCDVVLSNDRLIRLRADDSVMSWMDGAPYMIRRSRGYAPLPVMMGEAFRDTGRVLGIGGELKNTFCLGKDGLLYPSPYVGDLSDLRSVEALESAIHRMEDLLEIEPEVVCCDLHPAYQSSHLAESLGIPILRMQHHYAHVLSCMAENSITEGDVIGVSFDGTGYGTDGTIWGGEILNANLHGFERIGSLRPFHQAGGDLAAREGWRIAVSLLMDAYEDPAEAKRMAISLGVCNQAEWDVVSNMISHKINTVVSTSAGRIFDAVSAILGYRRKVTCEGEASMLLQFGAERSRAGFMEGAFPNIPKMPCSLDVRSLEEDEEKERSFTIDWRPMVRLLAEKRLAAKEECEDEGALTDELAAFFHCWMSMQIALACEEVRRLRATEAVCLTGGVMQNELLVKETKSLLLDRGFTVYTHSLIPPNDGGIAVGQALYAVRHCNAKIREEKKDVCRTSSAD